MATRKSYDKQVSKRSSDYRDTPGSYDYSGLAHGGHITMDIDQQAKEE